MCRGPWPSCHPSVNTRLSYLVVFLAGILTFEGIFGFFFFLAESQ